MGHRSTLDFRDNRVFTVSVSLDQTTRIHGAIPTTSSDGPKTSVWHEVARPQVHGYDLISAAFLDLLRFISIADEKVARVFEAPREFVEVVNNLGVAQLDSGEVRDRYRPRSFEFLIHHLSRKHGLVRPPSPRLACQTKP